MQLEGKKWSFYSIKETIYLGNIVSTSCRVDGWDYNTVQTNINIININPSSPPTFWTPLAKLNRCWIIFQVPENSQMEFQMLCPGLSFTRNYFSSVWTSSGVWTGELSAKYYNSDYTEVINYWNNQTTNLQVVQRGPGSNSILSSTNKRLVVWMWAAIEERIVDSGGYL